MDYLKGSIIFGVILSLIAIFMLVVVAIMSFAFPLGFWIGAKSAGKEYDDWSSNADYGDEIRISGRIDKEEKTHLMGETVYSYKFKGCDSGFLSSEDIGNEGDFVIVNIEKDSIGTPKATSAMPQAVTLGPNGCCCCLSGLVFIVGAVLIVVGLAKGSKKNG